MSTTITGTDTDALCINTIRGLCMDAVQKANSGHPGTPMGVAPVAYALWQRILRFDPSDPIWPNRDRFVLSEGHASTLLWSLLHLSGVQAVDADYEVLGQPAVTMQDLKTFRQLGSHCPGHPEYRLTSGVECTTGPLGQGVATSVGMAMSGAWLAERYNTDGHVLFDFDVYALAGDGCMMEGIASEAASLAGHLALSKLCWIYDSNRVTIEGHTDIAFTEDVASRFIAYGWNVTTVADANDLDSVARAFHTFHTEHERPTLILVHSHIGYGSPVEDSPKAHGEPLGVDGVRAAKRFLDLPEDEDFFVPAGVYEAFATGLAAGGGRPGTTGRPRCRPTGCPIASWRTSSTGCNAGTCPRIGRGRCRRFRPTRLVLPPATLLARCSTRWPRSCPGSSAGPPTCRPPPRRACSSRARAISRKIFGRAGTCTSASASTRRLLSPTAWR